MHCPVMRLIKADSTGSKRSRLPGSEIVRIAVPDLDQPQVTGYEKKRLATLPVGSRFMEARRCNFEYCHAQHCDG
ncbi:hypothetical protein NDU88_003782 [Pleurodeles waltl]|uniref:Uncharacterized protein n=1 Tax=Pleurodeles waltl TaxID=8319 RepID=A0AAV7UZG1_PLEWA|nr:hypothetical protein NDU88_003782 [Pleurodeles waltl]